MIDLSAYSYLVKSLGCLFLAIFIVIENRRRVKKEKLIGDGYLDGYKMSKNFRDWALVFLLVILSVVFLNE